MIVNVTNKTKFSPKVKDEMELAFNKIAEALKKEGHTFNKMHITFTESSAPVKKWSDTDIDIILNVVSQVMDVPVEQILQRNRRGIYVSARQLCYEAMYYGLRIPLRLIGMRFGGLDHSTIIHNLNEIKDKVFLRDIESQYFQGLRKEVIRKLNDEYGIIYKGVN